MAIPACVFASSSSVYGPDTLLPAREDHPANPCSPYALTKLHGEVGRDGLGAPTCPPAWAARQHGAWPANDISPSGALWVGRGRPTLYEVMEKSLATYDFLFASQNPMNPINKVNPTVTHTHDRRPIASSLLASSIFPTVAFRGGIPAALLS